MINVQSSSDITDIDAMTGRTDWLAEDKQLEVLIRFAHALGSNPNLPVEPVRPAPWEGQVWVLNENAGLPNRLIYVHNASASRISALGVSDELSNRSSKDFILDRRTWPPGFDLMIESWNAFQVSPNVLGHCVGVLTPSQIQSIRNLTAGQTDGSLKPQPIRWPGDARTDFQSAERRRYQMACRLSRLNAQRQISAVTVPLPAGMFALEKLPETTPGLLRMAAKTATALTPILKVYKPILENPMDRSALRVALAVWADGSVGITADASDPEFSAEFSTRDDRLLSVESHSVDPTLRVWKIAPTETVWQEGFESVFRVAHGLIAVSLRPGAARVFDPTLQQFGMHATRFEAGGSGLPEMLKTISDCDDRILRYLLEEDVKRVIRLDKHHPSWSYVYDLIRSFGTPNLWRWANEQNN